MREPQQDEHPEEPGSDEREPREAAQDGRAEAGSAPAAQPREGGPELTA